MGSGGELPRWMARALVVGFWAVALGIVVLALALRAGLADPRPVGRGVQVDDFGDLRVWTLVPGAGVIFEQVPGGLAVTFSALDDPAPGQTALALTDAPRAPFTLEVSGAQIEGPPGLAYGLVIGYQGGEDYAVVWLNNNAYVEAVGFSGGVAREWFLWQQWPHILPGAEANRVRVDVEAGGAVLARINDEVLVRFEVDPGGRVGVAARSQGSPGTGTVVFDWMKVWVD